MSDKNEGKSKRAVFSVRDIECATCARAMERKLRKVDGIEKVGSAIMLNKVFVDYDESKVSIARIQDAIRDAGYANHMTRDERKTRG